jgi:hypothetical protein
MVKHSKRVILLALKETRVRPKILLALKETRTRPSIPIRLEATKKETRKKMSASNGWKRDVEN